MPRIGGLLLCVLVLGAAEPNSPPTIDPAPIDPVVMDEDSGVAWLTLSGISSGGEAGQVLTVTAVSDNPAIIAVQSVEYASPDTLGRIACSSQPDAVGTAHITITVRDDGGGEDSVSTMFTVQVDPVNDPPSFDAYFLATWLVEDGPAQAIGVFDLEPGPANESGQQLHLFAVPLDPNQIEVVSIDYLPGSGEGTIWVRAASKIDVTTIAHLLVTAVDDGAAPGANRNATTFDVWIPLQAVNDPPQLEVNGVGWIPIGGWQAFSSAILQASDEDGDDPIFQLVQEPIHGTLYLYDPIVESITALTGGQSWHQSDIDAGRLLYRHAGGAASADLISFTISDGIIATPLGPSVHQIPSSSLVPTVPIIALYSPGATWTEGDQPVPVASRAVVWDAGLADYDGGRVIISLIERGHVDDGIEVASQGQIAVVNGMVTYGGVGIGTLSGGRGGVPLEVRFTGPACTPAAVQALIRTLVFSHAGDDPGSATRTIAVVVDDGQGGVSASVGAQVAVIPVEDPPILTTTRVATPAWSSRILALRSTDADGGAHLWSITAQPATALLTSLDPAAGLFTLVAAGAGEETFIAQVTDGFNPPSVATIHLTIDGGDGARPHPLADPPRQAVAGEELVVDLPFDTGDMGTGTVLETTLTTAAPAGVTLTALGATMVRLSWLVPADALPGSYVQFGLVAVDQAGQGAGLVPFTLRIVAAPGGGG